MDSRQSSRTTTSSTASEVAARRRASPNCLETSAEGTVMLARNAMSGVSSSGLSIVSSGSSALSATSTAAAPATCAFHVLSAK
uniref:Uncharacterized protein n=1 Tax=Arundo donax TaxID=35708 RepID=A0A0A9G6L9_ARUDO